MSSEARRESRILQVFEQLGAVGHAANHAFYKVLSIWENRDMLRIMHFLRFRALRSMETRCESSILKGSSNSEHRNTPRITLEQLGAVRHAANHAFLEGFEQPGTLRHAANHAFYKFSNTSEH